MELQWVKGTGEYLPEAQLTRERVVGVLRRHFAAFGFNPAETPILNHYELLASKYAGGAEILKETFRLSDQGGRELCLRYDLTVPFALMIGLNQGSDLALPLKRYEIGKVFRDGPVKKGRVREFTQCDADVVGCASVVADAELLALADQAFAELGLDARAELNHRKLLSALILEAGVPPEQVGPAILALDKLNKIGATGVAAELRDRGVPAETFDKLFERLSLSGPPDGVLAQLEARVETDLARQGLAELQELFAALKALGVRMQIDFKPSLARGLEIYTGPVFELFLRDESLFGAAIGSGGRYDGIIGQFLYPDQPRRHAEFPATGISFGLEPITLALHELQRRAGRPPRRCGTLVYLAPMGTLPAALQIAAQLRAAGIAAEVQLEERKLKKTLNHVNKLNVPFAIILGAEEVRENVVMLRNMFESTQDKFPLAAAIARIKSWRDANPPE